MAQIEGNLNKKKNPRPTTRDIHYLIGITSIHLHLPGLSKTGTVNQSPMKDSLGLHQNNCSMVTHNTGYQYRHKLFRRISKKGKL